MTILLHPILFIVDAQSVIIAKSIGLFSTPYRVLDEGGTVTSDQYLVLQRFRCRGSHEHYLFLIRATTMVGHHSGKSV